MRTVRLLLLAVTASLVLAGCGGESKPDAAAPTTPAKTTTPTPTVPADPYADWPPPLPPGVPTTGEHAWRATWTPDADAEEQYLSGLRDDPSFGEFSDEELINAGYAVCSFYYDGVEGGAPVDAMVGAGKYDAIQAIGIDLAARHRFCMNIDPYDESY